MDPFVNNFKRQVGWFVILGIGAIILIILAISLRTNIFAQKFDIYFSPPSATSFYEGQPVKFHGFSIGHIEEMDLQQNGDVRIVLSLLERYHNMLHKGSVAHLVREGLIGEQTLELTAGNSEKPLLQHGQKVDYTTTATVEQLLQDMKPAVANANTLLRELAELAVWLNNPQSDFRQIGRRFNALSEELNSKNINAMMIHFSKVMKNLQTLTSEMQQQHIGERLGASLQATSNILNDLRPLTRQLAKDGPQSIQHINSLISHVNLLSQSLENVASDLSELTPELPGLARESRVTITEMQHMLKNLQESWLFGGSSNHTQPQKPLATPALEVAP